MLNKAKVVLEQLASRQKLMKIADRYERTRTVASSSISTMVTMHKIFSQLIIRATKIIRYLLRRFLLPWLRACFQLFQASLQQTGHRMPRDSCEGIAKKPLESTSLNKAKVALEQGLELLASSQKLIRIAGRFEGTHKLASSSVTAATCRSIFFAY